MQDIKVNIALNEEIMSEYYQNLAKAIHKHIMACLKLHQVRYEEPENGLFTDKDFRRINKKLDKRGKKLLVAIVTKPVKTDLIGNQTTVKKVFPAILSKGAHKSVLQQTVINNNADVSENDVWEIADYSELGV